MKSIFLYSFQICCFPFPWTVHNASWCFMLFLDFAAFYAVFSPNGIQIPLQAGFTQENYTSPIKDCLFLLGRSFACAQQLQCICDLTLVKLSWIRFIFSKQQICDLFLKWCILFQSNFAPCLPFCSFVYL